MKKYYLPLFLLCFIAIIAISNTKEPATVVSTDVDLPISPKGTPEQLLYRSGYTASYNAETKIPNWVAWKLTREHTEGTIKRSGAAWHQDAEVPMPRATANDYKGSGWSRGHMCPAGDNKWDADAMYETFLFTNCCPQNANLNSGAWNQIEMTCRRWARKYGEVYIVCGPVLFRQQHATIGPNQVVVPEAFFKVVVCLNGTPRGIGYICRNTDGDSSKDSYVNTIEQIERITGITFFPNLSPEVAKAVKERANLK